MVDIFIKYLDHKQIFREEIVQIIYNNEKTDVFNNSVMKVVVIANLPLLLQMDRSVAFAFLITAFLF